MLSALYSYSELPLSSFWTRFRIHIPPN